MATLSVAGVGRWRKDAGWPWLRARTQTGENAGSVLLEECLLCKPGKWKKEFSVDVPDQGSGEISFELWTGESHSTDLLQFVSKWAVVLEQWRNCGSTKRYYEMKNILQGDCEGYESVTELKDTVAYVCITITNTNTKSLNAVGPESSIITPKEPLPAQRAAFRFVLPHRSLASTRKLRAVRVGQIVHEPRTDVLRDLLPLTLYGHTSARHRQEASTAKVEIPDNDFAKALALLQLSCQYADYCVKELDQYSSKVERRKSKCLAKVRRQRQRQQLLVEKRNNLQREVEVLSCSLDGMQSLLRELDPDTLAQLGSEYFTNVKDVDNVEKLG